MNCYFINYKVFVNIVKYKLDLMQKKMETSERDATNRSSFKCTGKYQLNKNAEGCFKKALQSLVTYFMFLMGSFL